MGISLHKRVKVGNGTFMNISKSGVSGSKKIGPVTVNTRGKISVNLGNGIVYRTSIKKLLNGKKR